MSTFAIHYPPVIGESFLGYMTRLLYINGYSELRLVPQILNCKIHKSSYIPGTMDFRVFIMILAPTIELEVDKLIEFFKPYERAYQELRNIQDVVIYTPKFCPICIQEKPYFQDSWQFLHVTHCTAHQVMLIDQCPYCSKKFSDWNGYLFEGCPYCGCKWNSFEFPIIDLPAYLLASLDSEQFDSIIDTLLFTLRPNDLMFRSLQGIALSVQEATMRLETAYTLLTHSKFRNQWINHICLSNKHFFAPSFDGQSVGSLLEKFSCHFPQQSETLECSFNINIPSSVSHLSDYRNKVNKNGIPYHRHLGVKEVAFILGIATEDVRFLIEERVIQPFDTHAMLRDQIFDLNSVTELLDQVNEVAESAETTNELISIRDFLPKLRFFGIPPGKFISILTSLRRHYYRMTNKSHWLDLLVNPKDMIQVLEDRYLTLLPDQVDKKDFQSMFGLSDEQMNNLMKNSDLHYSNWQRTRQCIKKGTIVNFCSQSIVLNRIAKLNNKNVHVFSKELESIGIYPAKVLSGTRDVFIYGIQNKDDILSNS